MPRYRLTAVALLVAVFAAPAAAQPDNDDPPPGPLVTGIVWCLDEGPLRKELKLTPAQVKDLAAARQKWWDFVYTTPQKELNARIAKEEPALEAAFKKILSPEQFTRAKQLAAQINWADPSDGPPWPRDAELPVARSEGLDLTRVKAFTLYYLPELADPLKLTDEQKKLVKPGGRAPDYESLVYLTPEQTAAARAFLGPLVKHAWKYTDDPRMAALDTRMGPFGGPPGPLGLTGARDVRAEIKMTDEQVKELAPLRERWAKYQMEGPDLSPEHSGKAYPALLADTDAALARVLKPEQLARLKQIDVQTGANGQGWRPFPRPPATPFTSPAAEKALGLSAEQKKAHAEVQKAYADAVGRAVKANTDYEATDRAIKAAAAERDRAVAAILTAEQAKKWADLRGAPFAGNTNPDSSNRGGFGGPGFDGGAPSTTDLKALREVTFGRYTLELMHLSGESVLHSELKLTPEQVQKAKDAYRDQLQKFPTETMNNATSLADKGEKLFSERSEFVEKTLADLLTPDQARRLRQVMIQAREGAPQSRFAYSRGVQSAVSYPGVAGAVKLTAEQKKKLIEEAAAPAAVLTDDQKKAVKAMLGEPFTFGPAGGFADGPGGFGPGFGPGGVGMSSRTRALRELTFGRYEMELRLLRNQTIQAELKMTPEQVAKAARAYSDQLQRFPTNDRTVGADAEKDKTAAEERSKFVEKALADLLTPDQVKRFRQLMLQEREQSDRDSFGPGRVVASAVSYPGVADAVKLSAEQRKKLVEGGDAAAVLTDDQKKAVKAMLGEPFKGNFSTGPPAKGGPGGGVAFPPAGPPEITPDLRLVRELTFGRYALELSQLSRNEAVQTELKLTPEQVKKAAAAYQDQLQKFPARDLALARNDPEKAAKLYEERSKFVEKALGEILTAEQAKRFRQVMIQTHDQPSGFGIASTVASAAAFPGVAEAVKLTSEQRKKLIDGTPAAQVLTEEQKAAVEKMRGEPFKALAAAPSFGPPGVGSPAGGFAGGRASDPERGWATLQRLTGSTGDTVDLAKLPEGARTVLKSTAERRGGLPLAESGIMTRATYFEYAAKNEALRAAAARGEKLVGEPHPFRELTFGRYTSELKELSRDAAIRAELKLTPEQEQKATAAYLDERRWFPESELNAASDAAKAAKLHEERSKFVEKALAGLLTVEQAERFRQIMLQMRERPAAALFADYPRVPVASAASYPGVAEVLKLSPEQRKKLVEGAEPGTVLTDGQKAAVKAMLGDSFTFGPSGGFARPNGPFGAPGWGAEAPTDGRTLRTKLVMALPWGALKLTPEQVGKLVAAITRYQVAGLGVPRSGGLGSFQPVGPPKANAAASELNKEVEAILTPDQLMRLDQLVVQARAAARLSATLTGANPVPLKLTPEQVNRINAAGQELSRVAGLLDRADLPVERADELRLELREQLDARIMSVLTAEQRTAWKELTGDPYLGFRRQPLSGAAR